MQRTESLTKWGPMGFASSTSWQNNDDEGAFRHQFWRKTRRVAASLPFAEDLLAAYYCAFDRGTPLAVKTSLVGALAYFVLPADVIPDVLPIPRGVGAVTPWSACRQYASAFDISCCFNHAM